MRHWIIDALVIVGILAYLLAYGLDSALTTATVLF